MLIEKGWNHRKIAKHLNVGDNIKNSSHQVKNCKVEINKDFRKDDACITTKS